MEVDLTNENDPGLQTFVLASMMQAERDKFNKALDRYKKSKESFWHALNPFRKKSTTLVELECATELLLKRFEWCFEIIRDHEMYISK